MDAPSLQWFYHPIALATLALILERFFSLPEHWHPLAIFRLFAKFLTDKVCHPEHGNTQQAIAGSLLLFLVLLICLTPVGIIQMSAELHQLSAVIWLWFAIRYKRTFDLTKLAIRALNKGQKRAARAIVSRFVAFDCEQLSPLGLAQAIIEVRLRILFVGVLAPLLTWYLLGATAALGVRLIIECYYLWPTGSPRYRYFGRCAEVLYYIVESLALLPLALVMMPFTWLFNHRSTVPIRQGRGMSLGAFVWLDVMSQMYHVRLGGPQKYQQQRYARTRFEGVPATTKLQQKRDLTGIWLDIVVIVQVFLCLLLFIYRP
tara:strand:+ start:284 stop:1234 length:951 start_codon:yes stop_codon:yes gene_type:complete